MGKWFGLVLNILGIGGKALQAKSDRKTLIVKQEHAIIAAETKAATHRIESNTSSDNEADLITVRNKKRSWKDEIVTYTFLTPVFVATISPFITAWKTGIWTNLSQDMKIAYENLNALPTWYWVVLFAIIVDVLGLRSFARPFVKAYSEKIKNKLKLF